MKMQRVYRKVGPFTRLWGNCGTIVPKTDNEKQQGTCFNDISLAGGRCQQKKKRMDSKAKHGAGLTSFFGSWPAVQADPPANESAAKQTPKPAQLRHPNTLCNLPLKTW